MGNGYWLVVVCPGRKPHESREGDLAGEENEDDDAMHHHDDLGLTSTMTEHK